MQNSIECIKCDVTTGSEPCPLCQDTGLVQHLADHFVVSLSHVTQPADILERYAKTMVNPKYYGRIEVLPPPRITSGFTNTQIPPGTYTITSTPTGASVVAQNPTGQGSVTIPHLIVTGQVDASGTIYAEGSITLPHRVDPANPGPNLVNLPFIIALNDPNPPIALL